MGAAITSFPSDLLFPGYDFFLSKVRDFEMELNLNWGDQLPLGPGVPGLLVSEICILSS